MSERLQAGIMTQYIGSTFEVQNGAPEVFALQLTNVVVQVDTERHKSFSLVFHGPLNYFLPQRIYKLKQPDGQDLEIFLVPVARDKDGFEYEAVFNYLVD